ncbi:4-hydroxy-tetrahydrodipicolinate reductase [Compostibacillus humi]|uniref:4-hydroxy-tetrahydrodipicolinate reductase n=2 Tax=Compostibacillus humi TaxID=1245525 RepID=A0A8J2TNJ8_9BACI|nr:4-hydroxy-tetrahydrodipicolinate reductase [Compostibacillus humi]
MINIVVSGPRGKMGAEAIKMIANEEEFSLLACVDRINNGKLLKDLPGMPDLAVPIFTDIHECFESVKPDVLIDLTIPEAGFKNTMAALQHGVRPVVGTSGIAREQLEEIKSLANEKKIGTIIAPNFAIGAVLMMKFSQIAAKYLPDVEIIEMHHDNKRDAPSGTAVKTAELIRETRMYKQQGHPEEKEVFPGARGADWDGLRIHSVRLPGLVAHQEVIFGGAGQTLTIRHDSLDRKSFMHGVKLSVFKVMELDHYVYGLENIIQI